MNRSLPLAAALGFVAAAQAYGALAVTAPEVTFSAGQTALTGPHTVSAGYVRLVLDNQDDAMRAHGVFRVRQGTKPEGAKTLVTRVFRSEEVSHEEEQALISGF